MLSKLFKKIGFHLFFMVLFPERERMKIIHFMLHREIIDSGFNMRHHPHRFRMVKTAIYRWQERIFEPILPCFHIGLFNTKSNVNDVFCHIGRIFTYKLEKNHYQISLRFSCCKIDKSLLFAYFTRLLYLCNVFTGH